MRTRWRKIRAVVRAGLLPIRFHDLRYSCLSLLASHGKPIRDLQALARHATTSFILQRYIHHYDSSARRTADTMGAPRRTLDRYSHWMPSMSRNTAGDIDKALDQQRRLPTFGPRTADEQQVATGKPVQLAWKYEKLPDLDSNQD